MAAPQFGMRTGNSTDFANAVRTTPLEELRISYKGKNYSVDTLPHIPVVSQGRRGVEASKYLGGGGRHFVVSPRDVAQEVDVDYNRGKLDARDLLQSCIKDDGPIVISPDVIHPRAYLAGRRPMDPTVACAQVVASVTRYLAYSGRQTGWLDLGNW